MWYFIGGLFVGTAIGFVVCALLAANNNSHRTL